MNIPEPYIRWGTSKNLSEHPAEERESEVKEGAVYTFSKVSQKVDSAILSVTADFDDRVRHRLCARTDRQIFSQRKQVRMLRTVAHTTE